jgi:hypothetical protein
MRTSRVQTFILVVTVLLPWNVALSQTRNRARPAEKPQPPASRKVTIYLKEGDPITGSFVQADANGVQIEVAGNRLIIKLDDIESISFSSKQTVNPISNESQKSAPVSDNRPDTLQVTDPPKPIDPTENFIGKWLLEFKGPTGQTMVGNLTVRKNSENLLGILQVSGDATTPSIISLTDNRFKVAFSVIEQGQTVTMIFDGTTEHDKMSGSFRVDIPNSPQVTFTGKKIGDNQTSIDAVLSIQAGIVYKMGGAQPVARVQFYLLDQSLEVILQSAGLQSDNRIGLIATYGLASKYPSQYRGFYERAQTAIQQHIVRSVTTDFNGLAQFEPISAGTYYVMGMSGTRGGFAIWNVPVNLPPGQSSIILDQNNAATSF